MHKLVLRLLIPLFSACAIFLFTCFFVPTFPLPFFVFAPLYYVLRRERSAAGAMLMFYIFGVFSYLFLGYGLQNYSWPAYLFLAILYSPIKYPLIAFFSYHWLKKFPDPARASFGIGAIWAVVETLVNYQPYTPTAHLSFSLTETPRFLQLIPYTGQAGVAFLIMWSNGLLSFLFPAGIEKTPSLQQRAKICASALAIISSLGIFGTFEFSKEKSNVAQAAPAGAPAQEIKMAVIQGAITSDQYKQSMVDQEAKLTVLNRYFSLSKQALEQGNTLLAWPETALWTEYTLVGGELSNMLSLHSAQLLGGFPTINDQHLYNSVLWLDGSLNWKSIYRKRIPIPLTESQFTPSRDKNLTMETPYGTIGTPICFETFYPYISRAMTKQGARGLVVFANDAGFERSKVSTSMTKHTILRALESRRDLLRVAQSGISAQIDAYGRVLKKTELFEQGIFPMSLTLRDDMTWYVRFGEWFSAALVFTLGIMWRRNQ